MLECCHRTGIFRLGVIGQRDYEGKFYSQAVTPQDMRNAFETNCIAPLFLSKAFLPLLQKAATKNGDAGMGVAKAAIIQVTYDATDEII